MTLYLWQSVPLEIKNKEQLWDGIQATLVDAPKVESKGVFQNDTFGTPLLICEWGCNISPEFEKFEIYVLGISMMQKSWKSGQTIKKRMFTKFLYERDKNYAKFSNFTEFD